MRFPYRRIGASDFWDDDPSSPPTRPARLGSGSAIFLHINIGTPTAGCVTLPVGELLEILRWLNPAASPRITRGVEAAGKGTETASG